jgi:arsenate reductase
MAEAFASFYGGEHVVAESAGLESSEIHPFTIEAMKEVGIDISNHISKKLNMKSFMASNAIVKLCEQVTEKCPVVPFGIMSVDWNVQDPLAIEGCGIDDVRKTRDEIRQKVLDLLKGMNIPIV